MFSFNNFSFLEIVEQFFNYPNFKKFIKFILKILGYFALKHYFYIPYLKNFLPKTKYIMIINDNNRK